MTDNYGADSNRDNGHDDVLTPEHDAVREPPSDYEFADEHGASAAEEHTEESATLAAETKPAGRSPLVPIVAAVGVLLLGGIAWWQFGGGVGSSQPAANGMPSLASAPAMPALTANPKIQDIQATTNAAIPASLPNEPMPAPMAPMDANGSAPALPVSPGAVVPASAVAASLPAAPMPVVSSAVSPSPAMMPPVVGETADQRIQILNARVDALQKSLDQANQQLGQVTNMVAANTSTASPSVKDLQDRIDRLEQELAQHASAPTLTAPATASGNIVAVAAPTAKTVTPHHRSVTKTVVHKEAKKAPAAAPTPTWVLRAASPGQAWVASSSTSRDLKQIQIGDAFEGIGKVTSIEQQDGSWVVKGTKGQIQ